LFFLASSGAAWVSRLHTRRLTRAWILIESSDFREESEEEGKSNPLGGGAPVSLEWGEHVRELRDGERGANQKTQEIR